MSKIFSIVEEDKCRSATNGVTHSRRFDSIGSHLAKFDRWRPLQWELHRRILRIPSIDLESNLCNLSEEKSNEDRIF